MGPSDYDNTFFLKRADRGVPRRVIALAAASVLAHARLIQVTIKDLVFSPAEIAAKVGDTVVWRNKDIVACPDYHLSLLNGRSGVRFFHLKVRTPPFGDFD